MRSTSNPAFRNLPSGQGGGYASFGNQGGLMSGASAYADTQASQVGYGRAGSGGRPITIDDIVTKTAVSGGLAIVAGTLTALSGLYILALPAFLIGIILSFALSFKPNWANAGTVLAYSALMGVALGGIAGMLEQIDNMRGIGFQALLGTVGVFVGMLIVYKTGAVKVTPRFTKWMIGALIGVMVLVLARFVGDIFFPGNPMSSGGALSILISLVIIGVAAFSLLLDFDAADQAVRGGAPAKFAWYIAFGLMTTLVWLYIEILRLLSYLRGD
ncbi:putative YccA/Bax inhibitor family protein [Pseudonocardia sediminis]|uniref:Putative YccA/Bax inhibitor family protein n=1 Tax=Pseudonocardia sediminis TaxID=1397368 RepID=A0A4Q7UQX6_PSEST|nr:Bax inhibitor-1/YccA family protein [Pseudonocardia sediminis]RZT83976.1 putative YccA/Bax inhibitor family protein [Pseudonocardia sediminis]